MKLTRLRLLGFKSFVESTDFLIEPGLTGVVGPNGCGKSNLVEALRWVMGETSHKSLRAADMDDVIFSGTNGRPSRNNAEVAMLIDNRARKAPAQFNEHEQLDVSRRIERDKGSTYRINGREVRARDVNILFADASTGSRSPALVHQGRIGEIIQAKPEQRRRVLEEAAGISGLHARRHEAELRLRAAEQNLARIEDVINQLASQVDSLKKQARQAVRYRNIAAQVRTAEATLFHLRWVGANAELAEAEQGRNLAVRVVGDKTGAQARASTRQAEASSAMPPLRDAEARAAAALQRLVIARETLEQEETRAKNRMVELDQRLDSARRRYRARAPAGRRRRSGAGALRRRRGNAQPRGRRQRRETHQRRPPRRRGRRRARGRREDVRRIDRDARRPHRAAQPAAGGARFPERAAKAPRRRAFRRRRRADAARREHRRPARPGGAVAGRRHRASVGRGGGGGRGARRGGAFGGAAGARRGARTARRGRAPRPAPRHRGQDARQAPARRHQEPLAGGDRRDHRHQGLRGRARRCARRRPRSDRRSVLAHALGRRRDRARAIRSCRTASSCCASTSRRPANCPAASPRSA